MHFPINQVGDFTPPHRDKGKAPRRLNPHVEQLGEDGMPVAGVDELSTVGYTDDTDITQLFEKTGHVWAHHCCAAWSEGVIQLDDYSLQSVDKAVIQGLDQVSVELSHCSFTEGSQEFCRILFMVVFLLTELLHFQIL